MATEPITEYTQVFPRFNVNVPVKDFEKIVGKIIFYEKYNSLITKCVEWIIWLGTFQFLRSRMRYNDLWIAQVKKMNLQALQYDIALVPEKFTNCLDFNVDGPEYIADRILDSRQKLDLALALHQEKS